LAKELKLNFFGLTRRLVADKLIALGFKKKRVGLEMEVASGLIGSVGLNEARWRGVPALEINPIMGMRSDAVANLMAELEGRIDRYRTPHICRRLAHLIPGGMDPDVETKTWVFREGKDNETIADDLAADLQAYGMPFLRENSSHEGMCRSMVQGVGWPDQIAVALPVTLVLLGRTSDAVRVAHEKLRKRHTGEYEGSYRQFVDRLESYVSKHAKT
jgi:hypothetical protein